MYDPGGGFWLLKEDYLLTLFLNEDVPYVGISVGITPEAGTS